MKTPQQIDALRKQEQEHCRKVAEEIQKGPINTEEITVIIARERRDAVQAHVDEELYPA